MPIRPAEIMLGKVWSMDLVAVLAAAIALAVVEQGVWRVSIENPVTRFLTGAAVRLFTAISIGIFMAALARLMPQFMARWS